MGSVLSLVISRISFITLFTQENMYASATL